MPQIRISSWVTQVRERESTLYEGQSSTQVWHTAELGLQQRCSVNTEVKIEIFMLLYV